MPSFLSKKSLHPLVCILLILLLNNGCFSQQVRLPDQANQNIFRLRPKRSESSKAEQDLRFGQTKEQRDKVQYYIQKMNDFMEKQHKSERINQNKTKVDDALRGFYRKMKDDSNNAISPEENGRHYEGDIILTPDQAEAIYSRMTEQNNTRVKRKFIGSKVRRWDPRKPIMYSFDGAHTPREQRIIELALEHWHNITCLNFIRLDDEPKGNRIVFTDVDGCASNVGRHPLGEPQYVSLAPECIRLGIITHEVMHSLGAWHEQSRPDRDYYVNVRWENIDRDSKGQFLKEQPADVDSAGVPYDYGSIMHYRSKAFARYDDLFTINTYISDYQRTIGQRDQLSFNDIRLMNKVYCSNSCPRKLACQRGGYTDPRNCLDNKAIRCRCPDGFTGQLCNEVMPGYGAECGGRIQVTSSWARISSPGYPAEFREGQECSWLLSAPKGSHVQFQFIGMDYVEIRNSTDFANTGMRYCCFGTPTASIISATEDMVVLFRSFYRGGKGFQAQFRSIGHSGEWLAWSPYSACSASCGSCGTRRRTRKCSTSSFCLGNDSETEVCNRQPCKGICPKKRTEDSQCGGLLALLKGVECNSEKVMNESCDEVCCSGFSLVNGICTK